MVLDSDLYYEHIHRLKIFGLSVAKMYLGNMHWKVPNVICHTKNSIQKVCPISRIRLKTINTSF